MAEIVNLRSIRKQRARARDAELAAEARVRHGRTGAQKRADRQEQDRAEKAHAGAKLDRERRP